MLKNKRRAGHRKKKGVHHRVLSTLPVARNMKMELLTVSIEKLWTQNTRIIHDV